MFELMHNLPDTVVGVTASGTVDAKDYETVLVPAVDAALERHERIRLLYHLGPAFTGFTSGAMWDDMRVGFAHFRKWEKVAVVTDHDVLAGAARMFAFVFPCPVKVFADSELRAAEGWIAA